MSQFQCCEFLGFSLAAKALLMVPSASEVPIETHSQIDYLPCPVRDMLVVFCVNQIGAEELTQGFSSDFSWWFPQVKWVTFKTTSCKLPGNCSKQSGTSCSGAWDTLRKPGPEIKAVHGPGNGRLPIPWFDRFTPSNMWWDEDWFMIRIYTNKHL